MAHFAQLDENNTVIQVIAVHNGELVVDKQTSVEEDGTIYISVVESETKGVEFCQSIFGADTRWVQTSYNNSFRGKYAAIGDVYDVDSKEFQTPVGALIPAAETVQFSVPVTQDIAALTSSQIEAFTSQQISGLE